MGHNIYQRSSPARREQLKALAMGSLSGAAWARSYQAQEIDLDAPSGDLILGEAVPLYRECGMFLEQVEPLTVIQIGSSSGREVVYFARRNPKHAFIGIDPYFDVIEVSKEIALPNTVFMVGTAQTIYDDIKTYFHIQRTKSGRAEERKTYQSKHLICFANGSLQYVQPEHLAGFFEQCRRLGVRRIFLNEPACTGAGNLETIQSSSWRGGFSYTHPYRFLGEQAGYTTQAFRIINPYLSAKPGSQHFQTRHYYWVGALTA